MAEREPILIELVDRRALREHGEFVPTHLRAAVHAADDVAIGDLFGLACKAAHVDHDRLAGLAIVRVWKRPVPAQVLWVFVEPAWRRRGLGTRLLARAEEELERQGTDAAHFDFMADASSRIAIRSLLANRKWSLPSPLLEICRIRAADIVGAPWLARRHLAAGIFSWSGLTEVERAEIESTLCRESPDDFLSPFHEEETIDPATSIGLRVDGELVGWMIAHRVTPTVVRFTTLYVRPGQRRRRAAAALFAEGIWRACHSAQECIFTIAVGNETMMRMLRGRLGPYLSSRRVLLRASRVLAG